MQGRPGYWWLRLVHARSCDFRRNQHSNDETVGTKYGWSDHRDCRRYGADPGRHHYALHYLEMDLLD